jgi:hypothetical protein
MRSLQGVSHVLATEGNICPGCGVREIKLSQLHKQGINPGVRFECDMCGQPLRYSTVKQVIGDVLFLHITDGPYDSSRKADVVLRAAQTANEGNQR